MFAVTRRFLASAALFLGGLAPASGEGLPREADYLAARQALSDGLPSVAAVKAGRLLEQTRWDSAERSALAALAVEAWLGARVGRPVLEILEREEIPNEVLRQAQARILTGELDIAETLLSGRLQEQGGREVERFLLAQVYLAQGNLTVARETLEPLLASDDQNILRRARLMKSELEIAAGNDEAALRQTSHPAAEAYGDLAKLLRARALVGLGRHEEAQDFLRDIFGSTGGGEHVHHAASILLADSLLRQQRAVEAVEALVQFLDNTLDSDLWGEAFDLLAKALATEDPGVTPPAATLRWIVEGNTAQQALQNQALTFQATTDAFRGHALLLAARWLMAQKRTLESLGLLEAFLQVHPGHPRGDEAMRLALETYGALKVDGRVNMLADQWRRRFGNSGSPMVAIVTGNTAYARGDFGQAAKLFQNAAQLAATLSDRRGALFNAGIAALRAGELVLYQSLLGQLEVTGSGAGQTQKSGDSAADLELAKALDEAARNQPLADTGLRDFIAKYPEHSRAAEAHVALAETLLLMAKPDYAAVESALKSAAAAGSVTPALRQRIAYTRLWLLEKQGNLKGVTDTGSEFLKEWPQGDLAAEVRMKVADAYFRQGNFASAGTEFELVVKTHPASPYADTALYFAGLSALSMIGTEGRETAISLWQELAQRGGPLSVPARQQQALAKLLDDKPEEALKLFDDLLTEKTLSEDLRRSLICEKAEILIPMGKTEPARLTEAIEALRSLRASKSLPYLWQARAGHTLAWALNEAGLPAEALEACYEVVRGKGASGPSNPAEYRWYYRAGFFGIDLLKASKQWESAARLAEMLAQSKGDRATEAKEQANTIRLEHFLWDGTAK